MKITSFQAANFTGYVGERFRFQTLDDNGEAMGPVLTGEVKSEYWDDKAVQMPLSPNPPLTLDELREMNGEPVWVTYGDGWKICYGLTDYRGYLCMEIGGGSCICMDHYGKGWLAYRRWTEGET